MPWLQDGRLRRRSRRGTTEPSGRQVGRGGAMGSHVRLPLTPAPGVS